MAVQAARLYEPVVLYRLRVSADRGLPVLDAVPGDLAWKKYMQFIRSAGTRRFADTVKYVGLDSPFEEGTVKKVAEKVAAWIQENQLK